MEKTAVLKEPAISRAIHGKAPRAFRLKDPFSSLSHLIFAGISFAAGIPLIIRAFASSGLTNGLSMLLFVFGLIGLYTASGIYHGLDLPRPRIKGSAKLITV